MNDSKSEPAREPEQTLILREEASYRATLGGEPLEGEVLPQPGEQFDEAARRMSKPFDT